MVKNLCGAKMMVEKICFCGYGNGLSFREKEKKYIGSASMSCGFGGGEKTFGKLCLWWRRLVLWSMGFVLPGKKMPTGPR